MMSIRPLFAVLVLALILTPARASHDSDGDGLPHHASRLLLETDRALAALESEPAFGHRHGPYGENLRLQAINEMRRFRVKALRFQSIAAGVAPVYAPRHDEDDYDDAYGPDAYQPRPFVGIGFDSGFADLWNQATRVEGPLYSFPSRARRVWDDEVCRRLRTIARLTGSQY